MTRQRLERVRQDHKQLICCVIGIVVNSWIIVTTFLVIAGCDEDPQGQDIEQACVDFGHEFGLSGERCELWTYTEGRDAWIQVMGGDCSKATYVRDYDELYEQCLPWFRTTNCTALNSNLLDSSCKGQVY